MIDFRLPILGEGIEKATIATIYIKENDNVTMGQALMLVESDKASIEIPSDFEGLIKEIVVKEGETIEASAKLFSFEASSNQAPSKSLSENNEQDIKKAESAVEKAQVVEAKPEITKAKEKVADDIKEEQSSSTTLLPASPAARRFARELQVDLAKVGGSGLGGRITTDDVKKVALGKDSSLYAALPDANSKNNFNNNSTQEDEIIKLSATRSFISDKMSMVWSTTPHVMHLDYADITEIESMRKKLKGKAQDDVRVSALLFVMKALVETCKLFPQFNAEYNETDKTITYKKSYNMGVAVDTPRGLLVPVVNNVENKSIIDIAQEISLLAGRAHEGTLGLSEMKSHTITITNLGSIGGRAFTPIINAPDTCIVGLMRNRIEPVYIDGEFKPRMMLPICLSYDHRVIDGGDAARFMNHLIAMLNEPSHLLINLR